MYGSYNTQQALQEDRVRELTRTAQPQIASQSQRAGLSSALIRIFSGLHRNRAHSQPARQWKQANPSADRHALTRSFGQAIHRPDAR